MLENVVRIGDFSYFIYDGKKIRITKFFINTNGNINKSNANDYMMAKKGKEGVIWASSDNRQIIICRNDDLGTPYNPVSRKKNNQTEGKNNE